MMSNLCGRLAGLLLIACISSATAFAEVPPRSHVGQTLTVSDADFERGQVYHLLPGEDSQLAITSVATLKRTILTSSRAVGYVVGAFDPEESEAPVLGAALRVPVISFASGSPTTDMLLRGPGYLNVPEHKEMTFELTGTSDVEKLASDDDDVLPWKMKLHGTLSARGSTVGVVMPAEVRFLLTNFRTFARTAGDLITVQGSFEIEPAKLGWEMPERAAGLVASSLTVDVFLLGSTLSPEQNLDPNVDLERWLAELRYLTLARDLADIKGAAAHGAEFLAKYRDDAAALDHLARAILSEPGVHRRDLALARQLVERAQKLDAEGVEIDETAAKLAALRGE